MNDRGQVTGTSWSYHGLHAFLYSNGQMMDLGTLGGHESIGYAINDHRQVVGLSYITTGLEHALLDNNGQMLDLNNLIDPALGVPLHDATGINDEGQIVANSYDRALSADARIGPGAGYVWALWFGADRRRS